MIGLLVWPPFAGDLCAFSGGARRRARSFRRAGDRFTRPWRAAAQPWLRTRSPIRSQAASRRAKSKSGARSFHDGRSFVYVILRTAPTLLARSRVLEYLNAARNALPADVSPTLGPDATGVGWVFQYALVDSSGHQNLAQLRTLQDWTLKYALGRSKAWRR